MDGFVAFDGAIHHDRHVEGFARVIGIESQQARNRDIVLTGRRRAVGGGEVDR